MEFTSKGYTSWINMWMARGKDTQMKDIVSDIMEGSTMKTILEGKYRSFRPT